MKLTIDETRKRWTGKWKRYRLLQALICANRPDRKAVRRRYVEVAIAVDQFVEHVIAMK